MAKVRANAGTSAAREIAMITFLIAATLASASPLLPPPWQSAPTSSQDEYARYTRTEPDGTTSILVASSRACDCQPATAIEMLAAQLNGVSGVSVQKSTATMCGQSAQHLVATGIARADMPTRRNIDVFFFRQGGSMYSLLYTFTSAAPAADAETALSALCQSS